MYKIILPNFEGPFDLLLYFIKRDELNVYDIPIAKITEEFLKYIKLIQLFDLELAGEFLVMAATLMVIKTQMLLPKTASENGSEAEDPRTELVQRLLEYKRFKEAAHDLADLSREQRYVYYRQLFEVDTNLAYESGGIKYKEYSLFDLLKAFKAVIDRNQKEKAEHVVNLIPVSVQEKKDYILKAVATRGRLSFYELVRNSPKSHIVAAFLAILELIKSNFIIISQSEIFDDIFISKRPEYSLN